MRRFLFFLICLSTLPVYTQTQLFRIFFTDKGDSVFSPGSPLYEKTRALYTERALERRRKISSNSTDLLDISDAPVYQPYKDSILKWSDSVVMESRWFNYIVVATDSSRLQKIQGYPFVSKVQPTSRKFTPQQHAGCSPVFLQPSAYGSAHQQLLLLNIPFIHSLAITGQDVIIGITDTGFQLDHVAFHRLKKIAEYDFIQRDSETRNNAQDHPRQHDHGTAVLSVIGGYFPDSLIGAAYDAAFVLAKTENLSGEQHIEEDHYLEALEWFDQIGVDVVSTSLSYRDFDIPEESYDSTDLNGKTALSSIAVNMAVKKGMIVVVAAGNAGDSPNAIGAPAEADSSIAVAAVTPSGYPTSFSSRGPRPDGELRPTLAAQGIAVRCVDSRTRDRFAYGVGTSMAAPLISGGIALMLSAFPELTPWQVRSLLYQTAWHAAHPDFIQGYGIANFLKAMAEYDIILSPVAYRQRLDTHLYRFGIFAYSPYEPLQLTASVLYPAHLHRQSLQLQRYGRSHFYYCDVHLELDASHSQEDSVVLQFTAYDPYRTRSSRPFAFSELNDCLPENLPTIFPQSFPHDSPQIRLLSPNFIVIENAGSESGIRLSLHSLDGRTFWEKQFSSSAIIPAIIELPSLAEGLYILQLLTESSQRICFIQRINSSFSLVNISTNGSTLKEKK